MGQPWYNKRQKVYNMSMMIEIRALKGAAVVASKDETRAYLTGVTVCGHTESNAGELYTAERDGQALLVATDGHRMVVGLGMPVDVAEIEKVTPEGVTIEPHNAATWEETIIPADMVKAILRVKVNKPYHKMLGSQFFWLQREGANLKAVFFDGQVVQGFKVIDASYPDWKRVFNPTLAYVNTPACANGLGFNSGYLADLDTFAACYGHEKTRAVQLFGSDSTMAPVVFRAVSPDNHKGFYLLMPMRV
jgi:hypothetical protein